MVLTNDEILRVQRKYYAGALGMGLVQDVHDLADTIQAKDKRIVKLEEDLRIAEKDLCTAKEDWEAKQKDADYWEARFNEAMIVQEKRIAELKHCLMRVKDALDVERAEISQEEIEALLRPTSKREEQDET